MWHPLYPRLLTGAIQAHAACAIAEEIDWDKITSSTMRPSRAPSSSSSSICGSATLNLSFIISAHRVMASWTKKNWFACCTMAHLPNTENHDPVNSWLGHTRLWQPWKGSNLKLSVCKPPPPTHTHHPTDTHTYSCDCDMAATNSNTPARSTASVLIPGKVCTYLSSRICATIDRGSHFLFFTNWRIPVWINRMTTL